VLRGATIAAAAPALIGPALAADRQVIVRTSGGAYGDAAAAAVYRPFTATTGIEVIAVPTSVGKLYAMYRSGDIELDVIDTSVAQLYELSQQGALAPIDYKHFRYTDPEDIAARDRHVDYVANWYFATVITFNSKRFPGHDHPHGWAEFWDIKQFPGDRVLQDISSGELPLEFALIADGVPMDKLYPLDVDRAFKSLDRIRGSVNKYYSNAAVVLQMLTSQEAVLAALWHGQGQAVKDAGGPIDIEWNEGMLAPQGLALLKGCKNPENAQKLIDFALQPTSQAALCSRQTNGPTNRKALALMAPAVQAKLPNGGDHAAHCFRRDIAWWHENLKPVSERWSQWLLG
jgi:putative spermidine/putrescine transport system substrate-binding protein